MIFFFNFSDLAKSGLFPRDSITFEDDEDIDAKHLSQKNVPPVKKKMLWKQKKKSYQQKSIVFNENEDDIKFKDEELNVPKERLFKSQLKVKIKQYFLNSHFDLRKPFQARKKSKSDWYLYDNNSIENPKSLEKFGETQQSQYFDALETIDESAEEESDDDMDDLDVSCSTL